MVLSTPRYSPTHSRGARTVSPTLEGRRHDALRAMSIGGVVCMLGSLATFWVIKHPAAAPMFLVGWLAITLGGLAFFRGLWLFIRD